MSAAPDVQGECAHVPPEEVELALVVVEGVLVELAAVDDALVELEPPEPLTGPPQTFEFGMQTWYECPSAPDNDMHVRSAGHAVAAQSGAQYSSPANCAQSEPAAQSEFWRHGGHAAVAPPTPVVLVLVVPAALATVLVLVLVLPPALVPAPMFVLPPALVPDPAPVPSPAPTPNGLPVLLFPHAAKPTAAALAIQMARRFFIDDLTV